MLYQSPDSHVLTVNYTIYTDGGKCAFFVCICTLIHKKYSYPIQIHKIVKIRNLIHIRKMQISTKMYRQIHIRAPLVTGNV